jgi:hypothetical protein
MSLTTHESAATFRKVKSQAMGAVSVAGVGDESFFAPGTVTLQLRKGTTVVVVWAHLRRPGTPAPSPSRVKADLVALGRSIAAQL